MKTTYPEDFKTSAWPGAFGKEKSHPLSYFINDVADIKRWMEGYVDKDLRGLAGNVAITTK